MFPKKLGTNAIRNTGPDTFAKHAVQGPKASFSGTDWQGIVRGGQLTLTVTATIRGESVKATLDGLSIKGQNPPKNAVQSYINSQPVPSGILPARPTPITRFSTNLPRSKAVARCNSSFPTERPCLTLPLKELNQMEGQG